MFIDASVNVAILLNENDHVDLIERQHLRHSSIVSPLEAVLGISKRYGVEKARDAVERFVQTMGIEVLAADATLLKRLTDAHGRYGKGTGHPARLNMGDCYSYVFAKRAGLTLLFKGDDFARTDLV